MFNFQRSARSKGDTNQTSFTRILSKALHLVFVAALVAGLALSVAPVPVAHAATITVTTTADELNNDGNCSLREAIQAANTDAAVDACPAGSGADTIVVPAGTYTLGIAGAGEDANATGDLDIASDLTIDGAGAVTTIIDGDDLDRVFELVTPDAVVEISGVTIRDGSADFGGGIKNRFTLSVTASTISSNSGVGGGGILNEGDLTLTGVTVAGNTANHGAGIFNSGKVTMADSTISSNTAQAAQGGGPGSSISPAAPSRSRTARSATTPGAESATAGRSP